jgi:hypothetical protein
MAASNDQEDVMADEFDRQWLALIAPLTWVEGFYALIGLTRLGEHPTTVERLAATLQRPKEEAIKLAWKASRVRPDETGRIHLDTPWPGASPRRRLLLEGRELPVSGCAPESVERVDPPETVVAMLSPGQANTVTEMEIEQINTDLCVQQPFFSSAHAAGVWLGNHPGGRVFPVAEMAQWPFITHIRDTWRPRILANAA